MNYDIELKKIEDDFGNHKQVDWESKISIIPALIGENPNNFKIYVRVIYILHNILVEEDYDSIAGDSITDLLKKYFVESYSKYSSISEYLFFIGKILYISEWYFGIDDDFKPADEKLAFKMQKLAYENEPHNSLYKWAYLLSKGDIKNSKILADEILVDSQKMKWLHGWRFPGNYILDSLKWCQKH